MEQAGLDQPTYSNRLSAANYPCSPGAGGFSAMLSAYCLPKPVAFDLPFAFYGYGDS